MLDMNLLTDKPALDELLKKGRKHVFKKGTIVQTTDGNFLMALITKGFVKRYLITNDGSNSIQAVYGPGSVFSLTSIYRLLFGYDLYEGPEIYYYETMNDTELYTLDAATLQAGLESDPFIYKDLMLVAGERLNGFIVKLENVSLKTSQKKVAHQLYYYAKRHGEQHGKGIVINIPLTHSTLANALSVTRETVSHAMSRLHKKGLVGSYKGQIFIPNLEKLKDEAYS